MRVWILRSPGSSPPDGLHDVPSHNAWLEIRAAFVGPVSVVPAERDVSGSFMRAVTEQGCLQLHTDSP